MIQSKTLFPKWLLSQHRIHCVNSSLGEHFFGEEGLFHFFFVGEGMFPGILFLWEKRYHYGSGPLHTDSARNVWKHSFLGLTPARDQWVRKVGDNEERTTQIGITGSICGPPPLPETRTNKGRGAGEESIAHSRQVRAAGCPLPQWLQLSGRLVTDQKQGSTTFSEAWLTLVHALTSD